VKFNIGCLKKLCKEFKQLDVLRKSKIFKGSFKQVLKDQCQMKKKEEPEDEEILIRTIKQRKKKFTGNRSNENSLN
jgi:hypothetical protein